MKCAKQFLTYMIGILIGLTISLSATAESAGTILFHSGNAIITRADQSLPIRQHDAVVNGDTIETRNGRVQIGFMDGAKVSLQPESIYKINRYEFSGEEDGTEYAFTELIKGGLRAISGLIGHQNRERYQLATPVATIGIRGTEFTTLYVANKLLLTTHQGSVDVCNAAGCRNAMPGESIRVNSNTSKPQYTQEKASISAVPPTLLKPVFIQAEQLDKNGISHVVTESLEQAALTNILGTNGIPAGTPPDPNVATTSNQTDILLNGAAPSNTQVNYLLNDGVFTSNANQNLSRYQTSDIDLQLIASNLDDFYSDAFVTMGQVRAKINNQSPALLSYIAGDATQPANLLQLANLNSPLQYNVLASTAPVLSQQSSTVAVGTPNSVTGSLSINFATYAYSYGFTIPIGQLSYSLTGNSTLTANSAEFSNSGSITSNLNNIGCLNGCSGVLQNVQGNTVSVIGRLMGPNAERAGIQYGFTTGTTETLTGSVVLGR